MRFVYACLRISRLPPNGPTCQAATHRPGFHATLYLYSLPSFVPYLICSFPFPSVLFSFFPFLLSPSFTHSLLSSLLPDLLPSFFLSPYTRLLFGFIMSCLPAFDRRPPQALKPISARLSQAAAGETVTDSGEGAAYTPNAPKLEFLYFREKFLVKQDILLHRSRSPCLIWH